MEAAAVWISSVAAGLSLLVALAVTLAWRSAMRRTSTEIAVLRARVEGLDPGSRHTAFGGTRSANQSTNDEQVVAEFLITDAGMDQPVEPEPVSSRLVLSATVGEPLVKMASFAYGVRRALTPENRNRIRFEMRREIRRARKARRAAGRAAASEARSQAAS
ncbi:MAG TPA: hypothetical protein VN108_04675 [Marmoricola sp.]|nr:hypothetical protein [Marmoricola sp.]